MTLPEWLREPKGKPPSGVGGSGGAGAGGDKAGGPNIGFIDRNLAAVSGFMKEVLAFDAYTRASGGLLQSLDARARLGGIMILAAGAAFMGKALPLAAMIGLSGALMHLSGVASRGLVKRVLPPVLFTAVLVLPVLFSFITPGVEVLGFDILGHRASVTAEGLGVAALLVLRVTAMVSLVALFFLTSSEADFFKGLKALPMPEFFITALFMTFRYVLLLLKTVEDTNLSKKSRTICRTTLGDSQGWFAGRAAHLLARSLSLSEEVSMAMASRGFTGVVKTLPATPLAAADYLWLGFTSFVFFLSLGL